MRELLGTMTLVIRTEYYYIKCLYYGRKAAKTYIKGEIKLFQAYSGIARNYYDEWEECIHIRKNNKKISKKAS